MYSDALMDQLAEVLLDISENTKGTWQDRAEYISNAMKERDTDFALQEFVNWFNQKDS